MAICSKHLRWHVAWTFGTQSCTQKPLPSNPNAELDLWYLLSFIEQGQEGLVVCLQDEVVTI